ncbi:hypothetical protein KEM54_002006 [Ascosphaera aggregata]|nr:hypothetical protein KEM54_002006 [Ascosphaera aggregata]
MPAPNGVASIGEDALDIIWTAYAGTDKEPMDLPTMQDSLEELTVKLRLFVEVIKSHHSLAFSTAFVATQYPTSDPVKLATSRMTPTELREYQAWMRDPVFPNWNKETCKSNCENWELGGKGKLEGWTDAVRLMFSDATLQKEHTIYLYKEAKALLPIIMAHTKLVTAMRQLTVTGADLTANELAEYKTAKKIRAIAAANVQKSHVRNRALTRDIADANEFIRQRLVIPYQLRLRSVTEKVAKKSSPTSAITTTMSIDDKSQHQKQKLQLQLQDRESPTERLSLSRKVVENSGSRAQGLLDRLDDYLRTSANPSIAPEGHDAPNSEGDESNRHRRERARGADSYWVHAKRSYPCAEQSYDNSASRRRRLTGKDDGERDYDRPLSSSSLRDGP